MFLSRFFTPPILIAAAASFVIGLTTTIAVMVWLRPILRYRRVRRRVAAALDRLVSDSPSNSGILEQVRRDAAALGECAGNLPPWYRIRLGSRQESPAEAAAHLSTLANTSNREHQRKRIAAVRQALNLY